ncbi:MAG: ATP-binding protein [Polyangiaceae bacterium]
MLRARVGAVQGHRQHHRRAVALPSAAQHHAGAVLMPRGTDALLRMFPVLRQLGQSAPPSLRGGAITADTELRRRAFAALREAPGAPRGPKPLVLLFDDLQWSDSDSDALLAELIRPPDAPPMFILATYRLR